MRIPTDESLPETGITRIVKQLISQPIVATLGNFSELSQSTITMRPFGEVRCAKRQSRSRHAVKRFSQDFFNTQNLTGCR